MASNTKQLYRMLRRNLYRDRPHEAIVLREAGYAMLITATSFFIYAVLFAAFPGGA